MDCNIFQRASRVLNTRCVEELKPMKCTKWIALLGMGALSLTGIPQAASAATAETTVCVNKKTGDMRAVRPVKKCKKSERRLVLNSQGAAGEPGRTGAQGPQGR